MYEVPFCLFENVGDLVEDAQDENLIAMIRLLKEAGYACSYRKTCASRSMMPQRRGRVYFIAINWRRCRRTFEEAKSITDEAMIIVAHLEGLNILPFDLFLLPDNSKELEAFRVKFMEDKRAQPELNDDNVWARKALMLFDKREISWSTATVDEKTKASPWFSVMPTRQGQVLGFMSQWDPEGRTVDVIHAIDRAAKSSFIPNSEYIGKADLLCSCVLPNCRMWDKKRCRLILGLELLKLQGIPLEILCKKFTSRFNNKQLSDLAGNAFCAATYLMFLIALLVVMPEDIAEAEDLFDQMIEEVNDLVGGMFGEEDGSDSGSTAPGSTAAPPARRASSVLFRTRTAGAATEAPAPAAAPTELAADETASGAEVPASPLEVPATAPAAAPEEAPAAQLQEGLEQHLEDIMDEERARMARSSLNWKGEQKH